MINQSELKRLFHYDPETGLFTRLVKTATWVNIGDIAGTVHSYGYICMGIHGRVYTAHRLVWLYVTGKWPKEQIDHINHDRADNRWVNLREATHRENNKNRGMYKTNASGICGVNMDNASGKWKAQINIKGKRKHLCSSDDFFEAVCARKSAENKFGFHPNHGTM